MSVAMAVSRQAKGVCDLLRVIHGSRGQRLQRAVGYTADGHRRLTAGRLTLDSIRRFKGRESLAIILVDVDFPDWRGHRALKVLYTVMTRAGLDLCILHNFDAGAS